MLVIYTKRDKHGMMIISLKKEKLKFTRKHLVTRGLEMLRWDQKNQSHAGITFVYCLPVVLLN